MLDEDSENIQKSGWTNNMSDQKINAKGKEFICHLQQRAISMRWIAKHLRH